MTENRDASLIGCLCSLCRPRLSNTSKESCDSPIGPSFSCVTVSAPKNAQQFLLQLFPNLWPTMFRTVAISQAHVWSLTHIKHNYDTTIIISENASPISRRDNRILPLLLFPDLLASSSKWESLRTKEASTPYDGSSIAPFFLSCYPESERAYYMRSVFHYQPNDFTRGPAILMMVMKYLKNLLLKKVLS
jgi:hypothetical protein